MVPYRRVYGVAEPADLPRLRNDGTLSKHLPEGAPFGLVGTSSFYKRESYPNGAAPPGSVTATYARGNDPWKGLDAFTSHGHGMPLNWHNQGADAGLYANDQIHAVRILALEPTTDRKGAPMEAMVIVFAEDQSKWAEDARMVRTVRSDKAGTFRMTAVPPGDYRAVALEYVLDGDWNDPQFLESLRESASRVTLRESEAGTVALQVKTGS